MKNIKNFGVRMGNLLDIFPTINLAQIKIVNSNFQDDVKHLAQDWQNVGNDIQKAMNEYKKTQIFMPLKNVPLD